MLKNMRRINWTIPVILAILLIGAVTFTIINSGEINKTMDEIGENTVIVTYNDQELCRFNLESLKAMPKVEINDHIKETGKASVDANFGGVLLRDVLTEQGVDLSKYSTANFVAMDGYTTAGTVDEILNNDKVYIVYEREGVQTKSKSEGGTGPMEIIITGEQFSLRNCKYLMEIKLFK